MPESYGKHLRERLPMAMFKKRGDLQWRAQIRRKDYPIQRKTFNS